MIKAKPIPSGYHTLTPHIVVNEGAKALDFYQRVFGAEQLSRYDGPGGKIMHADLRLGDSRMTLSDELPEYSLRAPKRDAGGVTSSMQVYVDDVDAVYERAIKSGATSVSAPEDAFHGDRTATIICPFGHRWAIATHIEDVSPEELKRRVDAWMKDAEKK